MKFLCDTQTYIWAIEDSSRLSSTARVALADATVEKWLSVASAWEMAIKVSIGKLRLRSPVEAMVEKSLAQNAIGLLEIRLSHIKVLQTLPFHHKDPFDRLLAAQALAERLPVISSDPNFDRYGVERIW